jgi:hypothetical protein
MRLALILLIACKGQEPAPTPGSSSAPAPVVVAPADAAPAAVKIAPPPELADLRLGMTFDQAARFAPALTSKDADPRVHFSDDTIDRIELPDATLAKPWGPPPWFDPTTGWFASVEDGKLRFVAYVPDPDLMTMGAAVLDHALRTLADPKLPVPPKLLDMGPKANPFTLQAEPGRVRVGMPIMSKRAALSSWLALLAQRFGAAKPTTPRHWTYDKAPVKIDATLDDLGDLELVLTPP